MTNEITAYEQLSNAVNSSCFSKEKFVKEYVRDHRQLQAYVFDLCLAIIKATADEKYTYDGRNEWCHKFAKEIVKNNSEIF